MNNYLSLLPPRYKALVGALAGFFSPIVTFYVVNQNMTLKEVLTSLVTGVVSGVLVHQTKNVTK